jgi:hypothetical protein
MTDVMDAPTDANAAAAPNGAPLLDGDTAFTVHLRWFVAMCSAAAGLWHVVYSFPHLDHHVILGQSFMAVGVLQIAWAAWVLRSPSRALLFAGGAAAVVSTLVWVFAHSTGISWYPGLETAEIIGWNDTVTKWFELSLALGVVALLLPKTVHREATEGRPNGTVIGLMFVAIASVLAINYIGAYKPTHEEGGTHTHGPEAEMTTEHGH